MLHLKTDSLCSYHWLKNSLSGRSRVRTKAAAEMLVRRRLYTLSQLIEEYELTVDVTLVRSEQNKADELTRVPQQWFKAMKKGDQICAAALSERQILSIHRHSGHPGVKRTSYFVRRVSPSTTKEAVRSIVRSCVDPSTQHQCTGGRDN